MSLSEVRLASEPGEIRAGPQTSLQFRRLPVRPQLWLGPAHTRPVADPAAKNTGTAVPTALSDPAVYVLDRPANSRRETSSPR